MIMQTSLLDGIGVVWRAIPLDDANRALVEWGHKMGPLRRPCYADATQHGLLHDGRLVAVACTAGLIQDGVGGAPWLDRSNAIELARLCAERPGICRVALRLWREFTFPTLGRPYAVSYQDADLHTGNVYRFDGWQRISYSASGPDTRSGRAGRKKWVWAWPPRQAPNSGIDGAARPEQCSGGESGGGAR